MATSAIFWIRDGVLIDRMPVNAVAFAAAARPFIKSDGPQFTALINFAFENSGVSCVEKLSRLGAHQFPCEHIEAAGQLYNDIAGEAALHCRYFPGIPELMKKMHGSGIRQLITSAVDQVVLDSWTSSSQGRQIAPYLTEILGKRSNISKGKAHFAYAREKYDLGNIYYVADAPAEIATGASLREEFKIETIAFANHITSDDVQEALRLISKTKAIGNRSDLCLDLNCLHLPEEAKLKESLLGAGADFIVQGGKEDIVAALSSQLSKLSC